MKKGRSIYRFSLFGDHWLSAQFASRWQLQVQVLLIEIRSCLHLVLRAFLFHVFCGFFVCLFF